MPDDVKPPLTPAEIGEVRKAAERTKASATETLARIDRQLSNPATTDGVREACVKVRPWSVDQIALADFVLGAGREDDGEPANETWIANAIDWHGEISQSKRLVLHVVRNLLRDPTRRQFRLLCEVFSIEQQLPSPPAPKE